MFHRPVQKLSRKTDDRGRIPLSSVSVLFLFFPVVEYRPRHAAAAGVDILSVKAESRGAGGSAAFIDPVPGDGIGRCSRGLPAGKDLLSPDGVDRCSGSRPSRIRQIMPFCCEISVILRAFSAYNSICIDFLPEKAYYIDEKYRLKI